MGGGYIALEFASMFSNLGTHVTILEHGDVIMPREDREVADLALQDLQDKGISVHTNVETTAFSKTNKISKESGIILYFCKPFTLS